MSEAAVLTGYIAAVLIVNRKKSTGFRNSYLMIPDGFGYNAENSCSFDISTLNVAVEVSEKIEAFCETTNVGHRKSYFSGRCMEELTVNIIEHGFTMDDKEHYCDIKVMVDADQITLRLRDNCRYFNIRKRYDSLKADDIDSSIGIRLVYALANEVNYVYIFNTNTLIIKM